MHAQLPLQHYSPDFQIGARLLGMALLMLLVIPAGWAQEIEEDWPDEIDHPPSSFYTPPEDIENPVEAAKRQISQEKTQKKAAKQKDAGGKKKWWSLGIGKKQKEYVPSEEEIVNVGPRRHPSASEPLFRLPLSLLGPDGQTVNAGFYLVRQQPGATGEQKLQLLQEGRLMLEVVAHPSELQPTTAGPVGPVSPMKAPAPRTLVESRVSPDYASLTIIVRQNGSEFRTDPIPTVVNSRKPLPF